ncbi:MICOS subunit MIC26 [Pseudozyma hubeiensis]|nr:MICOS subunit MIC26 [Pseudozyma hubeiensis]
MIAASARSASARMAAGVSVAMIAGTSSIITAKPIYNEEASSSGASKLPIYPQPDPKVEIVPVQTELERQVGSARRTLSHLTTDTRHSVRSLVDRWINIERSIEGEVKSLVPAHEPLTPGLLYVGVATLAGSIFTRYRAFPIRLLTPPLALVVSLNYFNPNLATNLGEYYTQVEQKYAPALTEQRRSWQNQGKKYLDSTTKNIHEFKDKTEKGVRDGLNTVEQQTGLKVGDVVAKKEEAKIAIKDQMKAV